MTFDREQLIMTQPLEAPYALFVGDITGWATQSEHPAAQVLLTQQDATMHDVLAFVGAGMAEFGGYQLDGQDVVVYAKIPCPGVRRLGANMIATWLLGMDEKRLLLGPVVICNGVRLTHEEP